MADIQDPERAYRRAEELVNQIESELSSRQSGRERALHGFWRPSKEVVLAMLRPALYGCPTYGVALDEWIIDRLDALCNVAIKRRELESQPSARMPAYHPCDSSGDCTPINEPFVATLP